MARALKALAAVSTAFEPKDLAKRCASWCSRFAVRALPGTPPAPMLRITRTAVFAGAAATAAVGGFALAGFDPSIATAPLVQERDEPAEEPGVRYEPRTVFVPHTPEPSLPLHEIIVMRSPASAADDAEAADESEVFVYQGGRLTESQVKALARQAGWPEHVLGELVEVAWCESRYDPVATNGIIRGLMQVHHLWFEYSGTDFSLWADPLVNLQVALVAYNYDIERGYTPWNQWECRPGGRTGTPNAHLFPSPTAEVHAASGDGAVVQPTATTSAKTPAPAPDKTRPPEKPKETVVPHDPETPTPAPATPAVEPPATEAPAADATVEKPPTPPVPPEPPEE